MDKTPLTAKWDERYRESERTPRPMRALEENAHLLPAQGTALDLACGLGGNALFLAEGGLRVTAWDLSGVAVDRIHQTAEARGLPLTAEVRDVAAYPPTPGRFDVITVGHYLERSLAHAIGVALRPGGVLFYQTFTREHVHEGGPRNPAFRLAPNELLALFAGLQVLVYREEGTAGDTARGFRDEALLVARRMPESADADS